MTPKPKKHKQQFEHIVYDSNDNMLLKVIQRAEKMGYELIEVVPSVTREFFTLFFKRPV